MVVGFVVGEFVLICVSLEDVGLLVLVFGVVFGVLELVEFILGVLWVGGFVVEVGIFLDIVLIG